MDNVDGCHVQIVQIVHFVHLVHKCSDIQKYHNFLYIYRNALG